MAENEELKRQQVKKVLRRRKWSYRFVATLLILLAVRICIAGNWEEIPVSIAMVVLIIGIAIWMLGSPGDYNAGADVVNMITMEVPKKIEEIYEAYRKIATPLGSCYLAKIATMKQLALVWGPGSTGEYLYFWLNDSGIIGYLGYSDLDNLIMERINEPDNPVQEEFGNNVTENICYHSDFMLLQSQLKDSLMHYAKTGEALPVQKSQPSQVYTFTEDFKLTGQHFELCNPNGDVVYEVEGTMPLKTLCIYDTNHQEVFRLTKKLMHALPTYQFYYYGEKYGVLEKKFTFVRNTFQMELTEGTLKLVEHAGSPGRNFLVTLNGRTLGAIMDDLELNMQNVTFDNSVLIVYDEKYVPLLTAMAVMVARELARDEEADMGD